MLLMSWQVKTVVQTSGQYLTMLQTHEHKESYFKGQIRWPSIDVGIWWVGPKHADDADGADDAGDAYT